MSANNVQEKPMPYPILEHDPSQSAFIEPSQVIRRRDMPGVCVISFFKDVIEQVADEYKARILVENRWEDGPHPVYEIPYQGHRLAFVHPGVGAPLASSILEEVIAFGCEKFMVCGGCGVLKKGVSAGHLVVVSDAVRDEGVSYHYLPPAREISVNEQAQEALLSVLDQQGLPYLVGKTWTTDAPYRETPQIIQKRRQEGCLTVEMEAAGLMSVAHFRDVPLGVLLYAGDDLSGPEWDQRGWQSKSDVRQNLFWLAAEAVIQI
jgi:uridine phosphorylase